MSWSRLSQIRRPAIRLRSAHFWPRPSTRTALVRSSGLLLRIDLKRSNYGLRMILPLIFLVSLLSGCTADSDCKFGHTTATASRIPQGLGVNIHFTDPQPGEVKMIADAGFRWVR